MRIAICDDTLLDLKNLENMIISYANEYNMSVKIDTYSDPLILLNRLSFDGAYEYNIIFLDIIMQKNGIDVAAELRKSNEIVPIIFTTSSKEYAIDAFKVHANDYLLKPISKNDLYSVLDRFTNKIKEKRQTISIKCDDLSLKIINVAEISYVEYLDRRISYHLIDDTVITTTSIRKKFLESINFEFEKFNFINCHHSFIVNMNQIKGIDDYSFEMKNGEKIPISKKILKTIRDQYLNYLLGE